MAQMAPNLGEAIGLQAKVDDRTELIVGELSRRRREEDAVAAAARKAAAKRQADIERNSANLGNWIISQESGIHPIYHAKLASMAEDIRQRFREGIEADKENYSTLYDPVINELRTKFKQETDKDRQSTKNIVRDIGVKSTDQKGKYDINNDLYSAISKGSSTDAYSDFVKANGGSDYYAMGMNIPKPEVLGWTKDAGIWASKLKSMYRKNSDGSKYIDPKDFEEQWSAIKNDPSAEWIQNADAINKAHGFTNEQSEAQVKNYILNLLPNQPAPDVSTGAGTGAKSKYSFSEPELFERTSKEGSNNYRTITVSKKGGGALPSDFYGNEKGQSVFGRPTGVVKEYVNTGRVVMNIAVPDKSLATPAGWVDMDNEEREEWLAREYDKDPNKFKTEEVPLGGANKDKFQTSYGKSVEEIFGQKVSKPAAVKSGADKVVVEKGGVKKEIANIGPEGWSKEWLKLKPGEKMIGLDGKTYIKK